MKSGITLLITVSILSFCASAQPVLTSNTNPTIGYTVQLASADTTGINEGLGGNNQIWDFSSLTKVGNTFSYNYTAASATLYSAKYPNATIAFTNQTAQGISGYSYISTSSSAYEMWGTATGDLKLVYTNSQILLQLPFTSTSSFDDYFEGTGTNLMGVTTTYRKGNMYVEADGFGTLLLPGKTFTNVLRVKLVQDFVDSTIISGNAYLYKYTITTYSFMHDDYRQQLLNISYTQVKSPFTGNTTLTKSVIYYPGNSVSAIEELIKNNVSVYPNPADGQFTITVPAGAENAAVEIMDITGKTIVGYPVTQSQAVISSNGLPTGIYTVRVTYNSSVMSVQKIAITH